MAAIALAAALAGVANLASAQAGYVGFDRNQYPGDAALPALRKSFRYTSYWLNNPPGESRNTWAGKRELLKQKGFGFLVLFNGRMDAQLQGGDAAALGRADGQAAFAAARREGFPATVRIFLDQEEGGRLLPEQAAYVFAWIRAVQAAGARAGVYCSAIPVQEGHGTISTARDIAQRLAASPRQPHDRVALWIANDACPPAPGCSLKPPPFGALKLAFQPAFVSVWQYAQSPRRKQFSAACPRNQAPDGNCYAPGLPPGPDSFIDLNVARSPDPSQAP
ncbi:MAG: glycoside hydrolase domain-containing protein [Acidobacteriota bacterium]